MKKTTQRVQAMLPMGRKLRSTTLAASGLLALAAGPVLAVDYHVDRGVGVNHASCGDPADPCRTIHHTLDKRAGVGDDIYLDGTTAFRPRGLLLDYEVSFHGTDMNTTVLDARNLDRHFRVTSNASVLFEDLSFVNGEVGGTCGGAIEVLDGDLEARRVAFVDNVADCGGALWSRSGSMLIKDSEFTDNQALESRGGAILCQNDLAEDCGSLEINDTVFNGNSSHRDGGAVWTGADTVIRRSDFFENVASYGDGGALHSQLADVGIELVVKRSQFSRNSANNGGAVSIGDGDVVVNRSSFVDNVAEGVGGGIYGYWVGAEPDALTIKNSTFARNSATTVGGVYAYAQGSIYFTTMVDNVANAGQAQSINGTFDLYRSIVTHDAVVAAGDECVGVFNGVSNLVDDGTCGAGNLGAHNNSELLDLRLWTGRTLSYGLGSASLAVDAANNCAGPNGVISVDQRGAPRPVGGGCDIGAWERQ